MAGLLSTYNTKPPTLDGISLLLMRQRVVVATVMMVEAITAMVTGELVAGPEITETVEAMAGVMTRGTAVFLLLRPCPGV